jgi:hypothetical protein
MSLLGLTLFTCGVILCSLALLMRKPDVSVWKWIPFWKANTYLYKPAPLLWLLGAGCMVLGFVLAYLR